LSELRLLSLYLTHSIPLYICVVIVIPWETVSQPISTTTTAGLTSSDCACLGSCTIPRPSLSLSGTDGRMDGPTDRPPLRGLCDLGSQIRCEASTCLPSITRCLHFNSFVWSVHSRSRGPVFWASIRCGSSLAMCLHPFAFAVSSLWHADNCGIVIGDWDWEWVWGWGWASYI